MRLLMFLGVFTVISGCAVSQHPSKRPFTEQNLAEVQSAELVLSESVLGAGTSWFRQDSSASSAQFGLLGGVISGIIDAIANAGPSARARKTATEFAEQVTPGYLNTSFLEAAETALENDSDSLNVSLTIGDAYQPFSSELDNNGKLIVNLSYLLSVEASAITIRATVAYNNDQLAFASPYTDKNGKPVKIKEGGPIYSNSFTYESDRLPLPDNSPEIEQQLIDNINSRYVGDDGILPEEKSDERKKYDKEIEAAKDGQLSKSEASLFLIRNWTAENGALSKSEVAKAHTFVLEHLLKDLSDFSVPAWEGEDKIVSQAEDGRTVRIIGSGYGSGSYVSSPGHLDEFATFGNAVAYPKEAIKKLELLKKNAKK